ncbi:MAG: tRNA (guanosine(46)-N7)-methyltransferase TrmB [Bacteroidota bacterium]|nr:tRNA (guanosine(46)-N7)-methyltransferase TrmB [Bacteroidota bacterium]
MGKNKLAKFAEMETFNNVLQSPFREVWHEDHPIKGKWNSDFFKTSKPLILELGCGKGEYTFNLGHLCPQNNYIGIDIKGARMWKGAKDALTAGLDNVGFLRTNIEMTDRFFAPGEVSEIWLTFPDPQMEKARKRLTSTRFINLYRRYLKSEGIINLKTDSNFQYQYTLAMAKENGFEILCNTDDLYQSDMVDEVLSIHTYYEQQWLNRGLTIKYLKFRIHDDELREPDVEIEKDPYRSFGRSRRGMVIGEEKE